MSFRLQIENRSQDRKNAGSIEMRDIAKTMKENREDPEKGKDVMIVLEERAHLLRDVIRKRKIRKDRDRDQVLDLKNGIEIASINTRKRSAIVTERKNLIVVKKGAEAGVLALTHVVLLLNRRGLTGRRRK